jgi:hypothetical protein
MWIVFFNIEDIVRAEFVPRDTTVNLRILQRFVTMPVKPRVMKTAGEVEERICAAAS